MENLKNDQLDDLRGQLKDFVSGEAACPIEVESVAGARCGGHSSHTDNDGWV